MDENIVKGKLGVGRQEQVIDFGSLLSSVQKDNKILKDENIKLGKRFEWLAALVIFGFIFLLFMVGAILHDSILFKNDITKERLDLLQEQINNKNCIIQ